MNINDSVYIKLTKAGKEQWQHFWHFLGHHKPVPQADESGFIKLSLAEVMLVFGSRFFPGAESVFEDNRIFIPLGTIYKPLETTSE